MADPLRIVLPIPWTIEVWSLQPGEQWHLLYQLRVKGWRASAEEIQDLRTRAEAGMLR